MAEILVCGGDLRQVATANSLAKKGHSVYTYLVNPVSLLSEKCVICTNPKAFSGEIVILPLPCSFDDIHLNCSSDNSPEIESVFMAVKSTAKVYGGKLTPYIKGLADRRGIKVADYLDNEIFSIKNAKLTAEGAIQIAMENIKSSISGMNALVIGFGRIGKLLCRLLWGMGVNVTVCARRLETLAWAEALGYKTSNISLMNYSLKSSDLIFNTVPARIIDKTKIADNSLYIELASKPYGAGVEFALLKISFEIMGSWVHGTTTQ